MVQGSNTNEPDLRPVTVITPKGRLAFAAPINVVRAISAGHRNSFHLTARYLYRRSLEDGIEDKRAARMLLAIRAMAAVHTHRLSQKLVAHLATGTAAPEFLPFRSGTLFQFFHWKIREHDVSVRPTERLTPVRCVLDLLFYHFCASFRFFRSSRA